MKGKVFIVVICLFFSACNNQGESAKTPDSANGNSEVPAGEDNHVMENNVSPEKRLEPHHTQQQVIDSVYSTRELKMAPTADTTAFYVVDSVKKY